MNSATTGATGQARNGHKPGHHWVVMAAIVLAAVGGYVVGVREEPEPVRPPVAPLADIDDDVVPAPDYRGIARRRPGPNADWQSVFTRLKSTPQPEPEPADREAARKQAVAERAARRAFAGAPPVIPHSVFQRSAAACLSCHQDGVWIGDAQAPVVSHEPRRDCLACHVEQNGGLRSMPPQPWVSLFRGRESAPGSQAHELAPPTVPHTPQQVTWAKMDCISCHGPNGDPGLRFTMDNPAHRDSMTNRRCQSCHVQDPDWSHQLPPR